MTDFSLDPRLAADSLAVTEQALCTVRLMNDRRFPWLLLVPKRAGRVEVLDLEPADQERLWLEIRQAAAALTSLCSPDKLNIAALGNQVAQLHVHLIARSRKDAAWPAPVWGVGKAEPWGREATSLIERLATHFSDR